MIARNIKNPIDMTKEFIELWVKFNEIYKAALEKPAISPEEENAFLETKSVLARKFQSLADLLSIDSVTVERTFDVINQILLLKNISTLSEQALRNLENNWHDTYISLNRLLGHLEAQKDISPKEGTAAKAGKSIARYIVYSVFVIILILIILFLVYILGPSK